MESVKPQLTYKEALSKATEICSHSEKCSYDIVLKCREWQLSREETTKVIEYLLKEKFLDLQRYATSFVSDKFRFNKWGKIKLAYALRQKQVEENYIREALSQLPAEAYQKVLRDLLSAKARTLKEQDTWSRRNKLLAFAQSHGFEVDLALAIIEGIK
ncbi:MAG TPA: regulatory protein RecX [Prolixibacteraceae bacterium]